MRYLLGALLLLGIVGACGAPPICTDGIKNGIETDLDCGGSCGKCADSKACAVTADCQSGVCTGAICRAPTCTDKARNGMESDVDCGGSCGKCAESKVCAAASDCQSGECTGAICRPTCTDSIKNGMETDLDCGGPLCKKCLAGAACQQGVDCIGGRCSGGKCNVDFLDVYRDMEQSAFGCTTPVRACHGTDMPLALTKYKAGGTADMAALMTTYQEVRKSVNLAQPNASPFLTKVLATRVDIMHLGGKASLKDENDLIYQRWLTWISAGAPF